MLTTYKSYAEMVQGVQATLPAYMRAMFEKGQASYWKPKSRALEAPWIRMHMNNRHFLIIDFDGQGADVWKKLPLSPNFVSHNPDSGNHQVFFWLKDPVHCHPAAKSNKPFKYLSLLEFLVDEKYGGDFNFSRDISKNPHSMLWDTTWIHDQKYSLKELEQGLIGKRKKLTNIKRSRDAVKCESKGITQRSVTIFNNVRLKAYREVRKYKEIDNIEFNDWYKLVLKWTHLENEFEDKEPLRFSEIASTAKSIAHWVWYVYNCNTRKKRDRKKMSDQELKRRQSLAAKMTNDAAVAATESKIKNAINFLVQEGKKPTKAAVARMVKISRVHVSNRYSHLFPKP